MNKREKDEPIIHKAIADLRLLAKKYAPAIFRRAMRRFDKVSAEKKRLLKERMELNKELQLLKKKLRG